jgi:hypothetical protein
VTADPSATAETPAKPARDDNREIRQFITGLFVALLSVRYIKLETIDGQSAQISDRLTGFALILIQNQ